MTIYIAGAWKSRKVVQEVIHQISVHCPTWQIVSTWTYQCGTIDPAFLRFHAQKDLQELATADVFVLVYTGIRSEGKAFELGFAHATKKPCAVLNLTSDDDVRHANTFYYLPEIRHVSNLQTLLRWVRRQTQK